MKMTMMMPGWSGYGGQTISPYVGKIEDGDTILGHSVSPIPFPKYRRFSRVARLLAARPLGLLQQLLQGSLHLQSEQRLLAL